MLRDFITQDLHIVLLLFCLLLIVVLRQLFNIRFSNFIIIIWNDRYSKLYLREQKKIDVFNGLLFTNFVISGGVFIVICLQLFLTTLNNPHLWLGFIACLLIILFVFRILIERTIAHFFDISEFARTYIFRKVTYRNLSGLVFIIANMLLMFTELNKRVLIFSALSLILIINSTGFFRFIKDYQKVIISHLFYFLLYLCALEIGPYVILYKAIKDYFV